ncbi:hypothetical protein ACHAPK_010726 [Fusarium culmorum]
MVQGLNRVIVTRSITRAKEAEESKKRGDQRRERKELQKKLSQQVIYIPGSEGDNTEGPRLQWKTHIFRFENGHDTWKNQPTKRIKKQDLKAPRRASRNYEDYDNKPLVDAKKRPRSEESKEPNSRKTAKLRYAGTDIYDEQLRQIVRVEWIEGLPFGQSHLLLDMIVSLVTHEVDRYYLLALHIVSIVFRESSHDAILEKLPSMMRYALTETLQRMSLEGLTKVYVDYPIEGDNDERIECWKQRIELFEGIELGIESLNVLICRGWEKQDLGKVRSKIQEMACGPHQVERFHFEFQESRTRAAWIFQTPQLPRQEIHFLCFILKGILQKQENGLSESKNLISKLKPERDRWEKLAKVLQELIEGIGNDGCEDSAMKDVTNQPLSTDDGGSRQIAEEAEPVLEHDESDSVVQTCRTRIRKYKSDVQKLREEHELVLQGLERRNEEEKAFTKQLTMLKKEIDTEPTEDSAMGDAADQSWGVDEDASEQTVEEVGPMLERATPNPVLEECWGIIEKYKSQIKELKKHHEFRVQKLQGENEARVEELKNKIKTEEEKVNKWESLFNDFATGAGEASRRQDSEYAILDVDDDTDGEEPTDEPERLDPKMEEYRVILQERRSKMEGLESQVQYLESAKQKTSAELEEANRKKQEITEDCAHLQKRNEALTKEKDELQEALNGLQKPCSMLRGRVGSPGTETATESEPNATVENKLGMKLERPKRHSPEVGTQGERSNEVQEQEVDTSDCALGISNQRDAQIFNHDPDQLVLKHSEKNSDDLLARLNTLKSENEAMRSEICGLRGNASKKVEPRDLVEPLKINTALEQWELAERETRHNQDSPPNGVSSPMQVSEDETVPVPDLRGAGNKFRTRASRRKNEQKDKEPGGEIKNLKANITTLQGQIKVSQREIRGLKDDLESWEWLHAWCTTKGFVVPDNLWLNEKSMQIFEGVKNLQEDKSQVEKLLENTINKAKADWQTCYTWLERKMDDLYTQLTLSIATREQNHSVDIGVIATDQSHDDRVPFPELNKLSERIQALSSSLQAILPKGGLFETDKNKTLSRPMDSGTQTDQSGADIERMKGEVARALELKNGYIHETATLTNQIKQQEHEYNAAVDRLNKEITRVKEKSDAFEKDLFKCEGELAAREEVMKKLYEDIAKMHEQGEDMQSKLRAKEQNQDSEKALELVIEARDEKIQRLKVELEKQQKNFNSEKEQLTRIMAELKSSLEKQSSEEKKKGEMMTSLDEQLAKIGKEFKNLEAQLSMKSKEVEECAGLEERFKEKLNEIRKLNEKYTTKEAEVDTLQATVNKQLKEKEKLTSALTHNIKIGQDKVDRLTRERTKIDDEVKKLKANEAETKGKIGGLNKELAATKEELVRLKTIHENHKRADHDIARKEKTINELQEQVKKVKENFQTLQEELSTCKEKMKEQEQFNQNIEDKKKEAERRQEQIVGLRKEFETLRERDEKVYNLQQTMSSDLASVRSALDMLKTEPNGQQGHGNDLSVVSAVLLSVETTLKYDTSKLIELGHKIDAMECLMRERSSTSSAESEISKLRSQFITLERMAPLQIELKLTQASLENVRKEKEELEIEKKILRDRLQNTQVEKECPNISILARQVKDSSTTLNQFFDRYKQDFDKSEALQVELEGLRRELRQIECKVDTYSEELHLAGVPLPRTFDTSPVPLQGRNEEGHVMYKFSYLAKWAVGRIREMGAELEKKETEAELTRLERSMAVDENNKTNTPFVHRDPSRSTVATPVSEHDTTFFTPDKDTTEHCGIKSISHSARQHTSKRRGSIGEAQYGKQKNSPSTYPSLPALPATKSMATQTDTPQPDSELATHRAARSHTRVDKPNTVLMEGLKISADFGGSFADGEKLRLSVLLHQISAMRTSGKIHDDVKTALKYKHIYQMPKQNKIWFQQLDQLFDKKRSLRNVLGDMRVKGATIFPGPLLDIYTIIFETLIGLMAGSSNKENIANEKTTQRPVLLENCVGFCQIPLGIAGPLDILAGSSPPEQVHAPLATYEGTLVASFSRGYKAFYASGGIRIEPLSNSMSRGPVFTFDSPDRAMVFARELPSLKPAFSRWAQETSTHILKEGGIRNGQFGSNVNTVNIVAAMFIATGQDPASTAEACWSHLTSDLDRKTGELTMSLYMPSLSVGVIGGGTGLPMQKEALKILKCDGEVAEQKQRLASLIAAFSLALDLSTSAAITNDTFTASHMRLGRGQELAKL